MLHSESCRGHTPPPPIKAIAHLRDLGCFGPLPADTIFVWSSAWGSTWGPRGPSQILTPFRAPGCHAHPHQGCSRPVSAPLGPLAPRPAGTTFGRASACACPRGREAHLKFLPHFESRGYHAPTPPTKAIAHPYWRPWGLWPPDQRTLFLDGVLYAPPHGCREAPRKTLPHSK